MNSTSTRDERAVGYRVARLVPADVAIAKVLFRTMAEVFEEPHVELTDTYVAALLGRDDSWIIAATIDGAVIGGITAHALPMTRSQSRELFVYDVAVRADHQRRGVGRRMMDYLRLTAKAAGILVAFVAADDEDEHAIEFYRRIGGVASPVTFFTFEGV